MKFGQCGLFSKISCTSQPWKIGWLSTSVRCSERASLYVIIEASQDRRSGLSLAPFQRSTLKYVLDHVLPVEGSQATRPVQLKPETYVCLLQCLDLQLSGNIPRLGSLQCSAVLCSALISYFGHSSAPDATDLQTIKHQISNYI